MLALARQMGQRLSAEQASSRADARAASVLQTVREPIVLLDAQQAAREQGRRLWLLAEEPDSDTRHW